MTFLEAKQKLARSLDINYADIANNGLFTDTDLGDYIQSAILKAWDLHPWPFTQAVETAPTVSTDYYDYPVDVMLGSIYLLKIAGKEYKKLLAEDYLKYFEDNPNAVNRFWTEIQTFIFINKNAYTVGDTLDLYGKGVAPVVSSSSDLLPFSPTSDNDEFSGNAAIVQLAYAEALASEKKNNPQAADDEEKKAYGTLNSLWKPFADQRATLQSKNRPMFNVPDFFGTPGQRTDPSYNGNFNYLN